MLLLSMPLEKFAQALRKRHPTHFWSGPLWALFEQLITGSLSNHHTIMNTTKATPDHHKCEFAAFRLSKFFSPSAAGVWGHRSPRAFGSFWPLQKELAARRNLAPPRLLAKASACLLKTTPIYFGEPFLYSQSGGIFCVSQQRTACIWLFFRL